MNNKTISVMIYSMAAALNFFGMTALIIVAALAGEPVLAAEIALIQAAVMAVFLSISANARNMILGGSVTNVAPRLQRLRLYLVMPAILLSVLLLIYLDVSQWLIAVLLFRKTAEWLVEVSLAEHEKSGSLKIGVLYVFSNGPLLGALLLSLWLAPQMFEGLLLIWALLPILFWVGTARSFKHQQAIIGFKDFLPYFGGTVAVGITNYLFRVTLILFAGKTLAGDLIAGFAVGAVAASVYTYAIGPALINNLNATLPRVLHRLFFASLISGISLLLLVYFGLLPATPLMISIGFSVIGGGLMILAQHYRMQLIQLYHSPTMVRDLIFGLILVGITLPLMQWLAPEMFVTLYLVSGALSLFVYRFHQKL